MQGEKRENERVRETEIVIVSGQNSHSASSCIV